MSKKVDFEITKVPNCNFTTKSVFDQRSFSISAVCWGPRNHTNWGIPVLSRYVRNEWPKWKPID